MSDDTPTERFDSPGAESPAAAPSADDVRSRYRPVIFALAGLGVVLLIAVAVLITILVMSGQARDAEPTAGIGPLPSETPSETLDDPEEPAPSQPAEEPSSSPSPSPSKTSAPPPPPAGPITSYGASKTTVNCGSAGAVTVTFSWNTKGTSVDFGVGTDFADSQPFGTGYPPVHSMQFDYQCGQPGGSQKYAIAVYDGSTVIARKTIVIKE